MTDKIKVLIKRLPHGEGLPLPAYQTSHAAGMDLMAAVADDRTLEPGRWTLIPTGLSIQLPDGYEAQIRPRSGLALKFGISLMNTPGTIDADYRGEVGVIMVNFGDAPFVIRRGDRIAQMVISKVYQLELYESAELTETKRSGGGFGHTGV